MAFKLTDEHITQHARDGFTVFRQIVPTSLIADMRREVEAALPQVREKFGPQRQRFSASEEFGMNLKPFNDLNELPGLVDAARQMLSDDHRFTFSCILVNPVIRPYCTQWHRDSGHITSQPGFTGELAEEWANRILWPQYINQYNCPLYADGATWFVPGSQCRMTDTPGEIAAANAHADLFPEGIENRVTGVELERIDYNYTANMPGAVQLFMEPGDFAVYRPHGWHIGNYVHYTNRATLHGWPRSDEEAQWNSDFQKRLAAASEMATATATA